MQVPILSYVPEALSPNLNLTVQKEGKQKLSRVVAVAPLDKTMKGVLTLTAPKGVKLSKTSWPVDLKPGARLAETVPFEGSSERGELIRAEWVIDGGPALRGTVPLGL